MDDEQTKVEWKTEISPTPAFGLDCDDPIHRLEWVAAVLHHLDAAISWDIDLFSTHVSLSSCLVERNRTTTLRRYAG